MKEAQSMKSMVDNADTVFYTAEEVAQHTSTEDCWTIYKGRVYDITSYITVHPGGKKIMLGKGKDCTNLFE